MNSWFGGWNKAKWYIVLRKSSFARCYSIAFDHIANCNYMPSNNLNYNLPGKSIDKDHKDYYCN